MTIYEEGTLYTLGYTHPQAATRIDQLMRTANTLLLDIRYRPRSRFFPEWSRNALERRYGHRYCWDQRLGNVFYRDRTLGIELAEGHPQAVGEIVRQLVGGTNVILLCACAHERHCHRLVVARLVQEWQAERSYL